MNISNNLASAATSPTAGVAVDIYWHDRVLTTYTFARSGGISIGADESADIALGALPKSYGVKTLAFVDDEGGFATLENELDLPFGLRARCRPLNWRAPPSDDTLTDLSIREQTTIILICLLMSGFWWVNHNQSTIVKETSEEKNRMAFVLFRPPQKITVEEPRKTEPAALPKIHSHPRVRVRPGLHQENWQKLLANIATHAHSQDANALIHAANNMTGESHVHEADVAELHQGDGGGHDTISAPEAQTVHGGIAGGAAGAGRIGIGKAALKIETGGDGASIKGGYIDRDAIRQVIVENRQAIQACYEKFLSRDAELYGRIALQWDIVSGGRVINAKTIENSMQNYGVAECVLMQLRTWRFADPPDGEAARVTYPFVFSSQ